MSRSVDDQIALEDFAELGELNHAARWLIQVICLGLLIFVAWAAYFTLDVVSVAQGEVIPADKIQSVQHLEGGVISKVLVAEGDLVEAGQPLVVLEATSSGASLAELQLRVDSLRLDILRTQAALRGDATLVFGEDSRSLSANMKEQAQALFMAQRHAHVNLIAVQDEEIIKRQKGRSQIEARLQSNKSRLTLLEEQISISENLLNSEVTSRYEHINLLKEANSLKSSIAQDVETNLALDAEVSQAKKTRDNMISDYEEILSSQLDQALRSYGELSERIKTYTASLDRTTLTAPTSGNVKTIYMFTVGGVVPPGATVLDLVPDSSQIVVEARLQPQDIAYVSTGDLAFVRLNSADAVRFGYLEGKVITISPDTLVSDQGVPFYQVRLSVERDYFERGDVRYPLVPGMMVTAGVVTGERSVLRYLLSPFLTTTWFALSER